CGPRAGSCVAAVALATRARGEVSTTKSSTRQGPSLRRPLQLSRRPQTGGLRRGLNRVIIPAGAAGCSCPLTESGASGLPPVGGRAVAVAVAWARGVDAEDRRTVETPLPYVAVHVVEAEGVRPEPANRSVRRVAVVVVAPVGNVGPRGASS